jgi:hypothetical protein
MTAPPSFFLDLYHSWRGWSNLPLGKLTQSLVSQQKESSPWALIHL